MSNHQNDRGWADKLTSGVLVVIVLLIGVMAGAASFTHVHDFTLKNSPANTADWFGWGNAVITELVPVASLIFIARRRRTGGSIKYALFLMTVFMGVSLVAQLAVAVQTFFGWLVSALPALAFFALSKLVFAASKPGHEHSTNATDPTSTPTETTVTTPATPTAASAPLAQPITNEVIDQVPAPVAASPAVAADRDEDRAVYRTPRSLAADRTLDGQPSRARSEVATTSEHADSTTHRHETVPTAPEQAPAPSAPDFSVTAADAAPPTKLPAPAALLTRARHIADAHHDATGEPITRNALAVRMRIDTDNAGQLLALLDLDPDRRRQPVLTANGAAVDLHQ